MPDVGHRITVSNASLPNLYLNTQEFIERTLCWENTVLFFVSCCQYLVLGVIYSKGLPYRQPLYTNRKFDIDKIMYRKPIIKSHIIH